MPNSFAAHIMSVAPQITERQKLYLDLHRCVDCEIDGMIGYKILDLKSRSCEVHFDSVYSAERAFFMVVWDCESVYLEGNTLVLRCIHKRHPMWSI